jgi:hypothetical protein
VCDLTIYIAIVTIPVYGLDLSCLKLWMTHLEGFWPVLAWGLNHNVCCGASTCDAERKRWEMLNGNRISQIGHSFQILSKGFLFCYGKVLLAFRFVFFGAASVGPMPHGSVRNLAISCYGTVCTRLRSREAVCEDFTGAVHISLLVVVMGKGKGKEREHCVSRRHWRWE